ncbi:hypothetical protein [Novosphingobium sp.]|uniref:hypothetical protein n=1 Tax=Novosphingobium sp. TaxID=1874826 RepID=UPI002FD90F3E
MQVAAQEPSILDVSPFMMPPRSTWAAISPSADSNVVVTEGGGTDGAGFRTIHLRKSTHATKQAAVDLARSGLVKTGDILLSFRPLWDNTLAYAHMQLGVSHSALAFVVSDAAGPFVMTLESPMSYSSPMNYPEHYSDLDAIHIIRPNLNAVQVTNLEKWARLAGSKQDRFEFYSDYGKPMYQRGVAGVSTPSEEAKLLAQILLGQDARKFASYCSEFVWAMLSLRDCDPAAFSGTCVHSPFSTASGMMTGLVPQLHGDSGLAQGAEASLTGGGVAAPERKTTLTQKVFVDVLTNESQLAGRMSSGHIAVAKANRPGIQAINGYYSAGEPAPVASAINAGIVDNVSPTSYIVRSNAGLDGFHYVGTVVFDR